MLNLRKIAVTGGLSSGKSSVSSIFKKLGAVVVSSDEIVHQLLSPHDIIGQQVIKLIGSDIVQHGRIDRAKIAQKVFNNRDLLHSLEQILHPAVKLEVEKHYQMALEKGMNGLFVAEIPLLFESDSGQFDATIAVISDPDLCRMRFKKTTGYDDNEFDRRMARQLPPEEKARKATFVIRNNGSLEDLRQAVIAIYKKLIP
jgi:dephospho-CoA kinase